MYFQNETIELVNWVYDNHILVCVILSIIKIMQIYPSYRQTSKVSKGGPSMLAAVLGSLTEIGLIVYFPVFMLIRTIFNLLIYILAIPFIGIFIISGSFEKD